MRNWKLKTVELEPYVDKLEPGDRALLGFCAGDSSFATEQLWVRVFAQLHDGKAYLGSVECPSSNIKDLNKNDQVTFLPKHVIKYKKASIFYRGGFA